MKNICGDLLDRTKGLYYILIYLEAALFMLFLFSLGLISIIRPESDDDDSSSSSSKSSDSSEE